MDSDILSVMSTVTLRLLASAITSSAILSNGFRTVVQQDSRVFCIKSK